MKNEKFPAFYRGARNRIRWWMQEFKRRRRCRGFHGWMVKRFGKPSYGLGCSWNWKVNEILCTVWINPMRLKIYEDGGKKTTSYDITERLDNGGAREHVLSLLSNNADVGHTNNYKGNNNE